MSVLQWKLVSALKTPGPESHKIRQFAGWPARNVLSAPVSFASKLSRSPTAVSQASPTPLPSPSICSGNHLQEDVNVQIRIVVSPVDLIFYVRFTVLLGSPTGTQERLFMIWSSAVRHQPRLLKHVVSWIFDEVLLRSRIDLPPVRIQYGDASCAETGTMRTW
jgi:hypothetical protein